MLVEVSLLLETPMYGAYNRDQIGSIGWLSQGSLRISGHRCIGV